MPVISTNYLKGRVVNTNLRYLNILQPFESCVYLFQNTEESSKHSAHSQTEFCGSCASDVPGPEPAQLNVMKPTVRQTLWEMASE